jgi:hypothetical protein
MGNMLRSVLHPRQFVRQWRVRKFGDYPSKLRHGVVPRANYGYCLYNGARLAKSLGHPKMSAIEFGVAGGNGLMSMEYHAAEISKVVGIEIEIYGFDTGEGLPKPIDYRDLPYHWKEGFYKMDVSTLQSKLRGAKLVLGDVADTLKTFFDSHRPAPIGAISFDLDFYSSTKSALAVFHGGPEFLLPRIFCYFDDTIGSETEAYNDFTGQRLAINEFNLENDAIKLGFPYCLLNGAVQDTWRNQIWVAHLFQHPNYNTFVSDTVQQLPIQAARG